MSEQQLDDEDWYPLAARHAVAMKIIRGLRASLAQAQRENAALRERLAEMEGVRDR